MLADTTKRELALYNSMKQPLCVVQKAQLVHFDKPPLQEAAEADVTSDPLKSNTAALNAADDSTDAATDGLSSDKEELQVPSKSHTVTDDLIQPEQTVDTGSQHVLKVCYSMNAQASGRTPRLCLAA